MADLVGHDVQVEALKVATQGEVKMTLAEWVEYFERPSQERVPLLNVSQSTSISLGHVEALVSQDAIVVKGLVRFIKLDCHQIHR